MPYIDTEGRKIFAAMLSELDKVAPWPDNPGELNYMFTEIIKRYWNHRRRYQAINDIVGALDGAKSEFQRRVVAPYEDAKIAQNGDVY